MNPKFKVGQIVMISHFVPPDLYEGESVAVIEVRPATHDVRYCDLCHCLRLDGPGWTAHIEMAPMFHFAIPWNWCPMHTESASGIRVAITERP